VHLKREEKAPRELAGRLGLAPGAPVFHSLIVHHDNGVPLQSEDRYVNPACAPGYLGWTSPAPRPPTTCSRSAPLWRPEYQIEASAPTAREARLLGIGTGDPCLVVVRRTMSRNVPITLARLVHPGQPLPARRPLQPMSTPGRSTSALPERVARRVVS
jgi:GntR family histidine utilization transcriptional repressor